MDFLLQLMLNPIYLFIFTITLATFSLWLKSKRRQKDIEKGVKKALDKMDKEKTNR